MTVRVPLSFGGAKERNTKSGRNRTADSDEKPSKKKKRVCPGVSRANHKSQIGISFHRYQKKTQKACQEPQKCIGKNQKTAC